MAPAAGGLAGRGSNISLSYATGSVSGGGGGYDSGGLVGSGDYIDRCFATGPVVGGRNTAVGGLAGTASFVTNSYAMGSVQAGSGKVKVGGLVGSADAISASYSVGHVAGGENSNVGGLLGSNKSSSLDYWDTETSGTAQGCGKGNCQGITGLTTEQLQSALPAGFDPNIWAAIPASTMAIPTCAPILPGSGPQELAIPER